MIVFESIAPLQNYLQEQKSNGKTIAFAPTMGALHRGHMSLMKTGSRIADIIVCSIFVNPTQFNDQSDLDKYPITIEADKKLLEAEKVDVLFLPTVDEVYPKNIDTKVDIDLGGMDTLLEGAFRPGHFDGVMQVVNRLLNIVQPDFLIMGQKDFQQFSIIQKMIEELNIPTTLTIVPIKRTKTGLAMSSRNKRLSSKEKTQASIIYKTLSYARKKLKKGDSVDNVIEYAMYKLKNAGFRPEYVSISDMKTLRDIKKYDPNFQAVISLAAWLGEVRLIDNIIV